MTPNEFKAWFDGFTEAFEGRIPTKAQWGRIKERVAEIDGKPVTERIYVDRYWPHYCTPIAVSNRVASSTGLSVGVRSLQASVTSGPIGSGGTAYNSMQAMNNLGRAEAAAIGAL